MTTEFAVGVVSSIAATLLIFLAAWSARRWGSAVIRLPRQFRLGRQLDDAGLLFFFSSRSDYHQLRGTATQAAYFGLAKRKIEMVGHSFSYGQHSQGVASELEPILRNNPALEIVLAILDPNSSLVGSLAHYINGSVEFASDENHHAPTPILTETVERLRADIVKTLSAFASARDGMPPALRARFVIKVYRALPVASVIMLDRGHSGGRTQVDLKLFGKPHHKSISFEVGNDRPLYNEVTAAWGQIIDTAQEFNPEEHLIRQATNE